MLYQGFDISVVHRAALPYAAVLCGRARPIESIRITNVSAPARIGWLNISISLGGPDDAYFRRRISNLAPGRTQCIAPDALPAHLQPGQYECAISIRSAAGEETLSQRVVVLPIHEASMRFTDAPLLAAYLQPESRKLLRFADRAVGSVGARDVRGKAEALYEAVRARRLPYIDVPVLVNQNCQLVRSPEEALETGGACADMSFLLATLAADVGVEPILILMNRHMLTAMRVGEFRDVESGVASGALLPVETTCALRDEPFERAVEAARERIRAAGGALMAVDTTKERRGTEDQPGVRSVWLGAGEARPFEALRCPNCRANLTAEALDSENGHTTCPSCGEVFRIDAPLKPESPEPASPDAPEAPAKPRDALPHPMGVRNCARMVRAGDCIEVVGCARDADELILDDEIDALPIRKIREAAFCGAHMRHARLPAGLQFIGARAFEDCAQLSQVDMPLGLSFLGTGAFRNCASLREIRVPGALRVIPVAAFQRCGALEQAELGEGIESISRLAFAGCASLKRIRIPASVKRIDEDAFAGCTALSEIVLLGGDTIVHRRAFEDCPAKI